MGGSGEDGTGTKGSPSGSGPCTRVSSPWRRAWDLMRSQEALSEAAGRQTNHGGRCQALPCSLKALRTNFIGGATVPKAPGPGREDTGRGEDPTCPPPPAWPSWSPERHGRGEGPACPPPPAWPSWSPDRQGGQRRRARLRPLSEPELVSAAGWPCTLLLQRTSRAQQAAPPDPPPQGPGHVGSLSPAAEGPQQERGAQGRV